MSTPAEATHTEGTAAGAGGLRWLILSVTVIVLDQLSKWYVLQHLTLAEPVHVMRSFRINHPAGKIFVTWISGPKGRRIVAAQRSYRAPSG